MDTLKYIYRAGAISWVKGFVSFVLKFALPPFSPPLPSVVQFSKQNTNTSPSAAKQAGQDVLHLVFFSLPSSFKMWGDGAGKSTIPATLLQSTQKIQ